MASSISTARANLHSLLAAHTWPGDKPQITFGAPEAYEEQEVVALLGVEAPDEDYATIGGTRPREETFVLVVRVKVHDPAGSGESVDLRGWVLADEVREVVYANPTLSNALAVGLGARVASQSSDGAFSPNDAPGWAIFVDVRVLCRARVA